ncbi:unnamed protein product [Parascedosporium putredinis]|uniref:Copper-containing nitrite reductase n=1 Tax=Parascedosporium putredinis TaxID=1442378 RepID=A0A9P1H1T8_9PEZI|nr:unnamed protein product [Parascedosporium putredinis]CAI7994085.1 unnamed protein product [Parascedosporium putredinis]
MEGILATQPASRKLQNRAAALRRPAPARQSSPGASTYRTRAVATSLALVATGSLVYNYFCSPTLLDTSGDATDERITLTTESQRPLDTYPGPYVPPPITRDYPVLLKVALTTTTKIRQLTGAHKYEQWTFNDSVPGPFIRARVGDVNETKSARFKLLWPGLYIYHCAAAPVPVHIANGMYGLMYVQPAEGDLRKADREYYVMQSEFYHEPPSGTTTGDSPKRWNFLGRDAGQTAQGQGGETVRIFFGNAGPNLTSSFHILGSNFINTISVPPGGSSIVDTRFLVPGVYSYIDHAIFRLDKGGVGYINVTGSQGPMCTRGVKTRHLAPGANFIHEALVLSAPV